MSRPSHPRTATVAGAVIAAAVASGVAGCATPTAGTGGNTLGTGASSPRTATPSAATGGAPKPAVTESNPPGDIPDNQAYVAFAVPGKSVSIKVPEGWARSSSGQATTFTDKLNGVQVRVTAADAAPSPASVRSADVPTLQRVVPKFALGGISTVRRAGQPVLLLTYQGDSAPNPVTGKVVRDAFQDYVFFRGGRRLDLTLYGPSNADNVDPWRLVSDSVSWAG